MDTPNGHPPSSAVRRAAAPSRPLASAVSELGTSDPVTWPPDRLGRVRRWEAAAAMAVLGVTEHHFVGHEDGSLMVDDPCGIRQIEALLDEVRPDTVLTFDVDGMTFHPDHIAVHHWVTSAWHRLGHPGRLLYAAVADELLERYRDQFEEWDMYMSDERPVGVPIDPLAVHTHLAGVDLDRKISALRAIASQTGGLLAVMDERTYAAQVADEAFVAADRRALVPAQPDRQ